MAATHFDLPDGRLYIGGEWRAGRGPEITSVFPADRSVNRVFAGASVDDVELAVTRAAEAQRAHAWRVMRAHERAAILSRIGAGIAENAERISHIQSRDTGKTLAETRALALSAAGTFRYFAAVCETMEDALTPARGDYLTFSLHEPLGVTAAITPWNSPIASDAQKVAPALAAGCAIVLKPSSWSPLVCLELARIIDTAGLPKGLFSTLPGAGSAVGDAIVTHPLIRKVAFTGGNVVGARIAHNAADKMMPVSLELGGKSPTAVFADCDMRQALAGVLFGVFSSSGQACIAGSRLFVQRAVYEEFLARLVKGARALRVGHPFEAATQVAPLVRDAHRDSVEAYIASARAEGGEVVCGGARPSGADYDRGVYLQPTVITGLAPEAKAAREEIFGPVLCVMPFDDEDDLVARANASVYGLAAGLWTRDFNKAWRVARRLEAGTVWINTYKQFSASTPFGGVKMSGLGREKGREGVRAYMAQKSLYWDMSGAPLPWAGAQDA